MSGILLMASTERPRNFDTTIAPIQMTVAVRRVPAPNAGSNDSGDCDRSTIGNRIDAPHNPDTIEISTPANFIASVELSHFASWRRGWISGEHSSAPSRYRARGSAQQTPKSPTAINVNDPHAKLELHTLLSKTENFQVKMRIPGNPPVPPRIVQGPPRQRVYGESQNLPRPTRLYK